MSAVMDAREALEWMHIAGWGANAVTENIRDAAEDGDSKGIILGLTYALEALGEAIMHRAKETEKALADVVEAEPGGKHDQPATSGLTVNDARKALGDMSPEVQRKLRKPFESMVKAVEAVTAEIGAGKPVTPDRGAGGKPGPATPFASRHVPQPHGSTASRGSPS